MKLFEVYINNNLEYEDNEYQIKLIVANSKGEAEIRAESWLNEEYSDTYEYRKPFFEVKEITEVDGFDISVSKKEINSNFEDYHYSFADSKCQDD